MTKCCQTVKISNSCYEVDIADNDRGSRLKAPLTADVILHMCRE